MSAQFYWKRSGWILGIVLLVLVVILFNPWGLAAFVWDRFATFWKWFTGFVIVFRLVAATQLMLCAVNLKRKRDKKEAVGTFNVLSWLFEIAIAILALVICFLILPAALFGDPFIAGIIELTLLALLGVVLSYI